MLWKELFIERISGRRGMLARIGILLLVLAALALTCTFTLSGFSPAAVSSTPRAEAAGITLSIGTVIACGLLLMVAVRASTTIGSERERDTWISLLCTPLSTTEILFSKLAGSLYAVRWFFALLLFNWLATTILVPGFLLSIPFLAGTLLVLAIFAAALGVFFSLWCRNVTRALIATLSVAFLLGGGYGLCCGCMIMPLMFAGDGISDLLQLALMSPLIPFLLAYPAMVGVMGADASSNAVVPMAYLLGNIGYLAAATGLLMLSHVRFEKFAGRISTDDRALTSRALLKDPTTRLLTGTGPRDA